MCAAIGLTEISDSPKRRHEIYKSWTYLGFESVKQVMSLR